MKLKHRSALVACLDSMRNLCRCPLLFCVAFSLSNGGSLLLSLISGIILASNEFLNAKYSAPITAIVLDIFGSVSSVLNDVTSPSGPDEEYVLRHITATALFVSTLYAAFNRVAWRVTFGSPYVGTMLSIASLRLLAHALSVHASMELSSLQYKSLPSLFDVLFSWERVIIPLIFVACAIEWLLSPNQHREWTLRKRYQGASFCVCCCCVILGLAGRKATREIVSWRLDQKILRRADLPVFLIGSIDEMPPDWQNMWSAIEAFDEEAGPPSISDVDYQTRRLRKDPERARDYERTRKPISALRSYGGIVTELLQGIFVDYVKRMELIFKMTYFPRDPLKSRNIRAYADEERSCWKVESARMIADFECLNGGKLTRAMRNLEDASSRLMSEGDFGLAGQNAPCSNCNVLRGLFSYTPKAFIPWHTNALDDHGYRGYFTLLRDDDGSGDGGESFFRWKDFSTGLNHEVLLRNKTVVFFALGRNEILWHSTYSVSSSRLSVGIWLPPDEVSKLYDSGYLRDAAAEGS